jgi:hypothetical protein
MTDVIIIVDEGRTYNNTGSHLLSVMKLDDQN